MVFAIECVAVSASRSALMKTETLSQKFSDLTSAATKFTGNSDDIIGGSFFAIRGSESEPVRYGKGWLPCPSQCPRRRSWCKGWN